MLMGWKYLTSEDRKRIETGIIENRVLGGPWHIELQPTNLCNVDCFFCISRGARHGESLEWPVLRDTLTQGRRGDLRMIRLTGGGEPLVYPHLRQTLELCGEQGIMIENVNTNGVLLPRHCENLIRVGLDWILVSLNETNASDYARTMKTNERQFECAIEGTKAMIAARDAAPPGHRPRVWLQFFLWKNSIAQIHRMYEIGRALNVDTIFIRTIFGNHWGHEKMTPADLPEIRSRLSEIIREDCLSGEYRLHFELSNELDLHHLTRAEMANYNPPVSENFPDFHRATPRSEYCYTGWYTTSVNASGEVFPCFQYHQMKNKSVGNLHRAPLDEIWRGAEYQLFRDQIHELVLLRGRMEPSDRYNRFIEHKCGRCEGCQYTHNLATPDFYERATRGIEEQFTSSLRLRRRVRNAGIYAAHRLLRRPA